MPAWSRRRVETIVLAMLAIASVIPLRYFVESRGWFLSEISVLCLAVLVAESAKAFASRSGRFKQAAGLTILLLGVSPVLFAFVARGFGAPVAFEMSALTAVGAVSLAIALAATTHRTRSLSLILSGFLVLFSAAISDSSYAAVLPIIWMLGCIWHLIANNWERLDLATPDSMERSWSLRPSILVMTAVLLIAGVYAAKDQFVESTRLSMGLMPTSGGSEWPDPAARSGVGTGDAAIAAKDHAESFGAVDSDIFLESTESSLFDMANDMFGEPKKKNKWERRQAMANEKMITMHDQASKSEKGGATFSTERMPPKKHRHFKNKTDASVVQWDGPTGIRLAMHRYDAFDGRDWTQSAEPKNEQLTQVIINDASWFFDPDMREVMRDSQGDISVGLVKVIRLDSQRIPVPMSTAGIHVKEVDRRDFFGIAEDGSYYMPGREKVPTLTVVHATSVSLTEDEIRATLQTGTPNLNNPLENESLDELVLNWTAGIENPYDQLQAIVQHLRTEFIFDRDDQSTATSLGEFLQLRRGGNHLFATAAALMARRIGLSSRLATGFYVRPDSFDLAAGHASVLPRDVHVWAEVKLEDGRWFEIEPTPGYKGPHYQPSWRLLAQRFAAAHWPAMAIGTLSFTLAFLTRAHWIDWLLTLVWSLTRWLRPRRRIGLAIRIIEARARMAGCRRPAGKSQRAWLEQITAADAGLAAAAQRFADAADAIVFGSSSTKPCPTTTELVNLLHVRTITALTKEATP
jgi:hypothetical protein